MKKEIVERLLNAGHITFDEALTLMEAQETVVKIETVQPINIQPSLQPYAPIYPSPNYPVYPSAPPLSPFWYGTSNPNLNEYNKPYCLIN